MSARPPIPRPGPGRSPGRRLKPSVVNRPIVRETSAGGVVLDKIQTTFFAAILARRNRAGRLEWCLPKGHVEDDESITEAAVREVYEETGVEATIDSALGHIEYWFHVNHHRVHKVVYHFLMQASGGDITTHRDPDQESIDVAWVPLTELPRRLAFTNERRIATRALDIMTPQDGHGLP